MANDNVVIERNGPVTTVIINRPEARNACTVATVKALYDAFIDFEADDGARIAVLTGQGDCFCAGADLKELASGKSIGFAWAGEDKGVTRRTLAKPVIAAVSGHAVAAGLALAVWCDLRVADETAVFGVFCRRYGGPMPNGVHGPIAPADRSEPRAGHDVDRSRGGCERGLRDRTGEPAGW